MSRGKKKHSYGLKKLGGKSILLPSLVELPTHPLEFLFVALVDDAVRRIKEGYATSTPHKVQQAHDAARWLVSTRPTYYISEFIWDRRTGFREKSYRETPIISAQLIFSHFGVEQQEFIKNVAIPFIGAKNFEHLRDKWRILKGDWTIS